MAHPNARHSPWDVTALLNAADPKAQMPERHLWLIRLFEWLRHAPIEGQAQATPTPVLRLKHLLGVLDRHPEHRARVAQLLQRFWRDIDSTALLADFGFAPRMDLWGELGHRLRLRLLPLTPATPDLGELFALLFPTRADPSWLLSLDDATLERVRAYLVAEPQAAQAGPSAAVPGWREPFLEAIVFLSSAVRAAGFSPALRQRMDPELLAEAPFRQLARVAEQVCEQIENPHPEALAQQVQFLRALLFTCRRCADSVQRHLEAHGISVDVIFEIEQLRERTYRIDALLTCVLSPAPAREIVRLLAGLVRTAQQRRSIRGLLSRHYSLLARQVAERGAATGEHYITRDSDTYAGLFRAAFGGGAVMAGTTFVKFAILALGLPAFWNGFWAGINYAASFALVQVLHFTIATKQPAMTAATLAGKLADLSSDEALEGFVDEVVHMIRSQSAGIFGNLATVGPLVLLVQLAWQAGFGAPLVGHGSGQHTLESLTLLGPTVFYAAFTGVLLFACSMIAGWFENWFVWHRLDSAIQWNPRIVTVLGSARAARWAAYWRRNIAGFASNISLGLMMGLVPAIAVFFGLPLEVRHVTLSTGQLAAAVGSEGFGLMREAAFWWCVAGIAATAVLNLTVSFVLALRVAMRSRGILFADRSRIYRAIRARMWRKPLSFVLPSMAMR